MWEYVSQGIGTGDLGTTGVVPGAYGGTAGGSPRFDISASGQITAATNVTIPLVVAGAITGTTTTGTLTAALGVSSFLTLMTALPSTSGTAVEFTGIPSGRKRIEFLLDGVSHNGTSPVIIQIGGTGGFQGTGYASGGASIGNGPFVAALNGTNGFIIEGESATTSIRDGKVSLSLVDPATNAWVASYSIGRSDGAGVTLGGGSVTLASELDRIRMTTVTGTNTFDLGVVGVNHE